METRDKVGRKLGLGSLAYEEEDGEEFSKACKVGYPAIVETIINTNISSSVLNKIDDAGLTVLHNASNENRKELVNVLLKLPMINLNVQTKNGSTPLHLACKKNHFDVVKVLVEQLTINLNGQNEDGSTPLHVACDSER